MFIKYFLISYFLCNVGIIFYILMRYKPYQRADEEGYLKYTKKEVTVYLIVLLFAGLPIVLSDLLGKE